MARDNLHHAHLNRSTPASTLTANWEPTLSPSRWSWVWMSRACRPVALKICWSYSFVLLCF